MKIAWYIIDRREGEAEPHSIVECVGWPSDLSQLFVVKYGTSTRYFIQAFSAFDALERWKRAGS